MQKEHMKYVELKRKAAQGFTIGGYSFDVRQHAKIKKM